MKCQVIITHAGTTSFSVLKAMMIIKYSVLIIEYYMLHVTPCFIYAIVLICASIIPRLNFVLACRKLLLYYVIWYMFVGLRASYTRATIRHVH